MNSGTFSESLPDFLFAEQFHQVVPEDPQHVEISGERLVQNLRGIGRIRAGQAQQGCPKRVGVLVGFDQEVVTRSGRLWHRGADLGARR